MSLKIWLCSLLLVAHVSLAAPLKLEQLTVGSRMYKNVTVLGANKTDLYFTHTEGIANIKLKLLSSDLQKRFKYDAKAAAEAEKQQLQDDFRYQGAIASNMAANAEKLALAAKKAAATSEDSLADPISESSLLGKTAPKLEVEKWLTDKPDTEGKFVLISFWAPWSTPSRRAIAELNALQKKFASTLAVIALTAETESEVENASDAKIEFASALDGKAKLITAAGVTSIPSVLLVGPTGIVLYQGHPGGLSEAKLAKIIKKSAE